MSCMTRTPGLEWQGQGQEQGLHRQRQGLHCQGQGLHCTVLCVCAGQPPARTGVPVAGGVGDDGWTAVSRPPKSNIVDPSRLKLTKREQVDESAIQLGPGGRGMGCWHRGSSGGGKQSVASPDLDLRQPNRFFTDTTVIFAQ